MIHKFDLVKVEDNNRRFLNQEMKDWLKNNKDRLFKVENIYEDSIKLFGVYFWITSDLIKEESICLTE